MKRSKKIPCFFVLMSTFTFLDDEITYACKYRFTRINDIAIAMSYSSHADPGLKVAFKYLNV